MTEPLESRPRRNWFGAARWSALLPTGTRARVCFALAILVAFAADFLFFTGFFASDDTAYLLGARDVAGGGPLVPSLWSVRLGVTLPDAAVYRLTGGDISWVAWFHVLYHLGLVVLAFHVGRLVASQRVGLVAAMLAALQPTFYVYAGTVLPDNVTSCWLGLLLLVLETLRRRRDQLSAAASRRWHVVAGLLLGVAYSSKETALIMTIPAAICVIAAAGRLRSWEWVRNGAWMAGGLAAFFVIEAITLWLLTGEPLWRLGFVSAAGHLLEQRTVTQGVAPWDRFAFAARALSVLAPLSVWLMVAACAAYVFVRRRNVMLLAFFWWSVVYLTIGTTSFSQYIPSSIQARYYAVMFLPGLVVVAIMVVRLHEWWGSVVRLPAMLRGRLRAAALSLAVGGLALFELLHSAPIAGNVYWAPYARGLAGALEVARDNYPQYPVLPEEFLRSRMRPLYWPESPEWLVEWGSVPDDPPAPPFMYLERVEAADRRRRGRQGGTRIESSHGPLLVSTVHTYYPPESRLEVVRSGLGQLFAVGPRRRVRPSFTRGGIALQLVTREQPPASTPELLRLDDIAWVEPLGGGVFHVSWGDPSRSSRVVGSPRFWLQTSDTRSHRRAPQEPASKLASPASAFSVDAGYRLLRGGRVVLRVSVGGYQADGHLVEASTEIELTSRHDTVTAHLDVRSTVPLVSYRVRTRVATTRKRGGLQVFPPVVRITASDATSSTAGD